jgi:hypothetical protein
MWQVWGVGNVRVRFWRGSLRERNKLEGVGYWEDNINMEHKKKIRNRENGKVKSTKA